MRQEVFFFNVFEVLLLPLLLPPLLLPVLLSILLLLLFLPLSLIQLLSLYVSQNNFNLSGFAIKANAKGQIIVSGM